MITYKYTLNTLIGLQIIWILIAGNLTVSGISAAGSLFLLTVFLRKYYRESYEYFTRYEPSHYDQSGRDSEPKKSFSESPETKLMKRLTAILFGIKIRHLDVGTRKYTVQYWYKGKYY